MSTLARPQRGGTNGAWTREGERLLLADHSLRFKSFTCGRMGYARVTGPLDFAAIGPFKQQVQRVLESRCRILVLDLSSVQFVDSEGVRALLQLREEAERRGARLRVVVPQGSAVERTLRLLRFDSLFSIFSSVAAAWRRRLSREGSRE